MGKVAKAEDKKVCTAHREILHQLRDDLDCVVFLNLEPVTSIYTLKRKSKYTRRFNITQFRLNSKNFFTGFQLIAPSLEIVLLNFPLLSLCKRPDSWKQCMRDRDRSYRALFLVIEAIKWRPGVTKTQQGNSKQINWH